MRVTFCPTRYAYSDRLQHLSRIKVTSLDTGRSVVLSVRTNRKIKGLCIPKKFKGRKTASDARFNMHDYVAAHGTLPLGTILLVKNLKNGRTVKVKVIDRGPFVRGRHLDLSYAAAEKLGMFGDGVVPFVAQVLRCGVN